MVCPRFVARELTAPADGGARAWWTVEVRHAFTPAVVERTMRVLGVLVGPRPCPLLALIGNSSWAQPWPMRRTVRPRESRAVQSQGPSRGRGLLGKAPARARASRPLGGCRSKTRGPRPPGFSDQGYVIGPVQARCAAVAPGLGRTRPNAFVEFRERLGLSRWGPRAPRRGVRARLEAAQTLIDVVDEAGLAHLTVVDDVDAELNLPAHDLRHRSTEPDGGGRLVQGAGRPLSPGWSRGRRRGGAGCPHAS